MRCSLSMLARFVSFFWMTFVLCIHMGLHAQIFFFSVVPPLPTFFFWIVSSIATDYAFPDPEFGLSTFLRAFPFSSSLWTVSGSQIFLSVVISCSVLKKAPSLPARYEDIFQVFSPGAVIVGFLMTHGLFSLCGVLSSPFTSFLHTSQRYGPWMLMTHPPS